MTFWDWLDGYLADEEPNPIERWLPRVPGPLGYADLLALRETGQALLRDESVAGTWRLTRLRDLLMLLVMNAGPGDLSGNLLMSVWQEIELNGAGPMGTPAQVLNFRGCILAEWEAFRPALDHFSAAIEADAGFVPAYLNRARAHLELDLPEAARADVEAALARDPDYPRARFTDRLVRILLARAEGRPPLFALLAAENGLLHYLRGYDRPPRPGEYPDPRLWDEAAITPLPLPEGSVSAEELNHVGVVNGRAGRFDLAISAFEATLATAPGYSRARFNLAKAYQMSGAHERAVEVSSALIDEGLDVRDARELRARSYRALWRIDEARADDDAVRELDGQAAAAGPPEPPDLPDLLRVIAEHEEGPVSLPPWEEREVRGALAEVDRLCGQGEYRAALAVLARVRQRPAPGPVLQARLEERTGDALAGLGQPARAVGSYSAALARLPAELDGAEADAVRQRCLQARARCHGGPGDASPAGEAVAARRADLHAALHIATRLGDRRAEGRLRVELARDAEAAGRPHEAFSWYLSADEPAREAEDWANALTVLERLTALAATVQRPGDVAAFAARRARIEREAGDLAGLGPPAPPRPDIVAAARDRLLARAPAVPITIGASAAAIGIVLDHADRLRREERRPAQALAAYYCALAACLQLDERGELAGCLTGLGSAYEMLAGDAAASALRALADRVGDGTDTVSPTVSPIGGFIDLIAVTTRALATGEAGELTECARAAYRWALEEARRHGDLPRQAAQISNLAVIEARLGNLDTAARYDRWALGVHLRAGQPASAAIDAGHLMSVAERLGDTEQAAKWRRRMEELEGLRDAA
jgi:tetratricopeptide (TPR) repeat protein